MDMLLAEVGVRCDQCGTSFVSRQLPTFIDIGYRNSELRQDYRGYCPMMEQYAILTCPSCGRADWSTQFAPTPDTPVLAQANASAHMQFRQAALSKERSLGSINSYQAAVFYTHAAWCADDSKAFPQAREYRRLAVDSFKRSLTDSTCPQDLRAETEYLIGELMRRSGDFDGAREHFRMCIGRLSHRFAFMARKLMRLCDQGSTESIQFEADTVSEIGAMQSVRAQPAGPSASVSGLAAAHSPPAAPAGSGPPAGGPPGFNRSDSSSSNTRMPAVSPPPGIPPSGAGNPPAEGPPGAKKGGLPGGKTGGPPNTPPPGGPPLA